MKFVCWGSTLVLLISALTTAGSVWADGAITRTLTQSFAVSTGGRVQVENLVGHMTVVQGGGPLQVTATVVAGGADAQALAQSIRLEVSTMRGRVLIHVHYPTGRFDTFAYNPPGVSTHACILGGVLCFNGSAHSTVTYQGTRVRINESSDGESGAPLHVDLTVHLPTQVSAVFSNAFGLLQTDGLSNDLSLATQGSDIHVRQLRGNLEVHSRGGDVKASNVTSQDARIHTDGGDLTGAELSGDLQLDTSGGDIKLDNVDGKLDLGSGGGDLRLSGNLALLQTLNAHTGGGDLTVSGDLAALATLNVDSGGGDIVLRASGLSAHLEASSGGGDINVTLPDLYNVINRSNYFSADVGKAAGTGTLRSGGGGITVSLP